MNHRAFFREVADRLRCDERRAEAITFVVFQELRARITPKESSNVAAQLPSGLKKLWLENERADRGVERLHLPEFIGRVRQHAALPDDAEAQRGTRAVFAVLQHLLGSPSGIEGEAWDVFSQLPKDLKRLWLDASRVP
jgi:uncharacterized protein (DUF2267 family)